ncbi:hypothetical protein ABZX65_27095 [Streptomyces sp. NPDC003300]|uniref:hypothetical protein n=1 Tax=unclassified Streptomyces TaxID=2593676 RepID=UPI0033A9CFA6
MRAFYRGYHEATGRRARQVRRLHVMREDGKFAGKQALCGAAGWGHTHSPPVVIDPLPVDPPEGLTWCRSRVGYAADQVGQLAAFARLIAAIASVGPVKTGPVAQPEPEPEQPAEGRCGRCRQTRPLFSFSYVPEGWAEFVQINLCNRCHSLSALEDDDNQLNSGVFAEQPASSFA